VAGRRLVSVEQCIRITSPDDAARLLPPGLPELFDTAQLAEAAAIERRLAQQMTYCLRALGVLQRQANAATPSSTANRQTRSPKTESLHGGKLRDRPTVPQCVAARAARRASAGKRTVAEAAAEQKA
jgi:hypothetical protein